MKCLKLIQIKIIWLSSDASGPEVNFVIFEVYFKVQIQLI